MTTDYSSCDTSNERYFSLMSPKGPQRAARETCCRAFNESSWQHVIRWIPRNVTFEDRASNSSDSAMSNVSISENIAGIWTNNSTCEIGGKAVGSLDPRYYGFSVGHWEELVLVDTVDIDQLLAQRSPHSGDSPRDHTITSPTIMISRSRSTTSRSTPMPF